MSEAFTGENEGETLNEYDDNEDAIISNDIEEAIISDDYNPMLLKPHLKGKKIMLL